MPVLTAELDASSAQGALLRQLSPTELLDRALFLLRRGPVSRAGWGFVASIPLATVCLGLYYLEVIEGVRTLRPVFAGLLAAGFVFRAVLLSRLAQELVVELRPGLPRPEPGAGELVRITSIAAIAGVGSWFWLWPLAWLAQLSPFAMVALVPLLALRGGVAPSWLARARCAAEGGMRAWGLASDDAAGSRASLVFVELLLLAGMVGAFANLFALTALLLVLSHSVLGLDVAFVAAFLSTDNDFVAYLLLALVIFAFDPVRAAISACVFADARSRKDGADLHAAIDALLAQSRPEPALGARPVPARRAGGVALVLIAAWLGAADAARAQVPEAHDVAAQSTDDARVRATVERILARREFAGNTATGSRTFENWLRDLFERWFDPEPDEREADDALRVALPDVSPWLVMAVVLTLLAIALLYVGWETRQRSGSEAPAPLRAQSPRASDHPGRFVTADAQALAAAGDYTAALRVLYAATLAALDRARLIDFDPAKTNGYYLRALPAGALRDAFDAFTRIFDRTWYGRQAVSREEYERGFQLAERICARESKRP